MRKLIWLGVLVFAAACGSTEASTPDLCERACEAWDACTGADNWYPYDTCMSDCQSDGDWDTGYVECLESHSTCQAMEADCG